MPYEIFASVLELELQCQPEKKKKKEVEFLISDWGIVKEAGAKPCKLSYYAHQDICKKINNNKINCVTHYFQHTHMVCWWPIQILYVVSLSFSGGGDGGWVGGWRGWGLWDFITFQDLVLFTCLCEHLKALGDAVTEKILSQYFVKNFASYFLH